MSKIRIPVAACIPHRKRALYLVGALLVAIGAVVPAAAHADDVGPMAASVIEFGSPGGNAPDEVCGERTSPGYGRAYICSAFQVNEFGTTEGYYRGTVYGRTFVQVSVNNNPWENITTRPNFRGLWAGSYSVIFRACVQDVGCGAGS